MDININISKDRSITFNTNSSRELSTHSNLSSISYVERIKAQSNNSSWAKQVELNELKEITLFYVISEIRENKSVNKTSDLTNTSNPQGEYANNSNTNTCLA